MRRWFSTLCALGTLFVIGAAVYGSVIAAMPQLRSRGVEAQALGSQESSNTKSSSLTPYVNWFAGKGITLASTSDTQIKNATWQNVTPSDADLIKSADMLKNEWQKYSTQTIAKSGLKKIYLVKNLNVDGQNRSGMPDPIHEHALYFDISNTYITSEDGAYMRRVFHHEFSHLIEYDLFGSYRPADAAWDSCNPAGFAYGNGGPSMYNDPEYAHAAHPLPGFIDGYATSGVEEDKAEVFANFMTSPDYLQKLAGSDTHLACKLSQTQALLAKL